MFSTNCNSKLIKYSQLTLPIDYKYVRISRTYVYVFVQGYIFIGNCFVTKKNFGDEVGGVDTRRLCNLSH